MIQVYLFATLEKQWIKWLYVISKWTVLMAVMSRTVVSFHEFISLSRSVMIKSLQWLLYLLQC